MEIRDIRYFKVVAQHGNLARAAEALELNPTALSKSLRRLEDAVGTRLVQRTPKGVALTAAGNALAARADKLQLLLDDTRQEAADLGKGRAGHIHIATGVGIGEYCIAHASLTLMKEAPDVSIKTELFHAGQVTGAVRKGLADFAVTHQRLRFQDIIVEELFPVQYAVFASASHRLARKKRLTLADLVNERWVSDINSRRQIDLGELFAAKGLPPPKLCFEATSFTTRLPLIESSDLIAFASDAAIQLAAKNFRLVVLPVEGIDLAGSVVVSYRKDGYLSPAARRFIEILKAQGRAFMAQRGVRQEPLIP